MLTPARPGVSTLQEETCMAKRVPCSRLREHALRKTFMAALRLAMPQRRKERAGLIACGLFFSGQQPFGRQLGTLFVWNRRLPAQLAPSLFSAEIAPPTD